MARAKTEEGRERYQSARQRRGRPKPKLQPPLAPMIDVTFQLLIFFLLTATFRVEGNLPYEFPPVGIVNAEQEKVNTVKVVVYQHGEGQNAKPGYLVRVGNINVAEIEPPSGNMNREQRNAKSNALFEVLREESGKGDEVPANIVPEGGFVKWDFVVEAYNQTRRAGFIKVGIDVSGAS